MITLGKYHPPAIMEPFTPFWWECMVMIILIITIVVRVPFHFKSESKTYAIFIALFFQSILLLKIIMSINKVIGTYSKTCRYTYVVLVIFYVSHY